MSDMSFYKDCILPERVCANRFQEITRKINRELRRGRPSWKKAIEETIHLAKQPGEPFVVQHHQ